MEEIPSHISAPKGIDLKQSEVDETQIGAWCTVFIPKGSIYGPFVGEIVYEHNDKKVDYRFAWEVYNLDTNDLLHIINATDAKKGNWMRYVNCARYLEEQNLVSVQEGLKVYYKAIKDVNPGEELLTWFEPFKKKRKRRKKNSVDSNSSQEILIETPEKKTDKDKKPVKQKTPQTSPVPAPKNVSDPEILDRSKRQRKKKKLFEDDILLNDLVFKKSRHRRTKEEIARDELEAKLNPKVKVRKRRSKKNSIDKMSDTADNAEMEVTIKKEVTDVEDTEVKCVGVLDNLEEVDGVSAKSLEKDWVYPDRKYEYQFDTQSHFGRTLSQNGRRMYKCDICAGIYRHTFSLKRHYLRNHINCRYLSKTDVANCMIVVGQQQLAVLKSNSKTVLKRIDDALRVTDNSSSKDSGSTGSGDSSVNPPEKKEDELGWIKKEKEDDESKNTEKVEEKSIVSLPGLYKCNICFKLFDVLEDLKSHTQHHSSSSDVRGFYCDKCNMRFTYKHNLVRHNVVHEKDGPQQVKKKSPNKKGDPPIPVTRDIDGKPIIHKPFRCSRCPMKFRYQVNLDRHQAIHEADRPYTCSYCGKAFPTVTNMKKHEHVHLGSKVPCKYCTAVFVHVGSLRKHIRLEHPDIHRQRLLKLLEKRGKLGTKAAKTLQESYQQDITTVTSQQQAKPVIQKKEKKLPQSEEIDSKFRFACVICKKRFTAYVNMCRHRRLAHKEEKVIEPPKSQEVVKSPTKNFSVKSLMCMQKKDEEPIQFETANDPVDDSPEANAQFYANVAANIAENLNSFIDGGAESLLKYREQTTIQDFDASANTDTPEDESVILEQFNFPKNYNLKRLEDNFVQISEMPVIKHEVAEDVIDGLCYEDRAPALCTRRRSSLEGLSSCESSRDGFDTKHFIRAKIDTDSPVKYDQDKINKGLIDDSDSNVKSQNLLIGDADSNVESQNVLKDDADSNVESQNVLKDDADSNVESQNVLKDDADSVVKSQNVKEEETNQSEKIDQSSTSELNQNKSPGVEENCGPKIVKDQHEEQKSSKYILKLPLFCQRTTSESEVVENDKKEDSGKTEVMLLSDCTESTTQCNTKSREATPQASKSDHDTSNSNEKTVPCFIHLGEKSTNSNENAAQNRSVFQIRGTAIHEVKQGCSSANKNESDTTTKIFKIQGSSVQEMTDSNVNNVHPICQVSEKSVKLGEKNPTETDNSKNCQSEISTDSKKENTESTTDCATEGGLMISDVRCGDDVLKSWLSDNNVVNDDDNNSGYSSPGVYNPPLSSDSESDLDVETYQRKLNNEKLLQGLHLAKSDTNSPVKQDSNIPSAEKIYKNLLNMKENEENTSSPKHSPFHEYETIAFGKHGKLAFVCSVCKKNFGEFERMLRHQWKKHPSLACHFLEVEQGHEIEYLYYHQPRSVGILGTCGKALENITDRSNFTCTRCKGSFKSVDRLRVHIINCAPKPETPTSPVIEKVKKKRKRFPKKMFGMDHLERSDFNPKPLEKVLTGIKARNKKKIFLQTPRKRKMTNEIMTAEILEPAKVRRKRSYDVGYNPGNHVRRREMTELLDRHQCKGCGVKFKSISLLERHVRKCDGKDKFKDLKVMKSTVNESFHKKMKHTCFYCARGFAYPKTLMNHFKAFCVVKKEKITSGVLTEEERNQEAAMMVRLKQQDDDRNEVVTVYDIGEGTRKGWPKGMKRKARRKNHCWTYIKKRKSSNDGDSPTNDRYTPSNDGDSPRTDRDSPSDEVLTPSMEVDSNSNAVILSHSNLTSNEASDQRQPHINTQKESLKAPHSLPKSPTKNMAKSKKNNNKAVKEAVDKHKTDSENKNLSEILSGQTSNDCKNIIPVKQVNTFSNILPGCNKSAELSQVNGNSPNKNKSLETIPVKFSTVVETTEKTCDQQCETTKQESPDAKQTSVKQSSSDTKSVKTVGGTKIIPQVLKIPKRLENKPVKVKPVIKTEIVSSVKHSNIKTTDKPASSPKKVKTDMTKTAVNSEGCPKTPTKRSPGKNKKSIGKGTNIDKTTVSPAKEKESPHSTNKNNTDTSSTTSPEESTEQPKIKRRKVKKKKLTDTDTVEQSKNSTTSEDVQLKGHSSSDLQQTGSEINSSVTTVSKSPGKVKKVIKIAKDNENETNKKKPRTPKKQKAAECTEITESDNNHVGDTKQNSKAESLKTSVTELKSTSPKPSPRKRKKKSESTLVDSDKQLNQSPAKNSAIISTVDLQENKKDIEISEDTGKKQKKGIKQKSCSPKAKQSPKSKMGTLPKSIKLIAEEVVKNDSKVSDVKCNLNSVFSEDVAAVQLLTSLKSPDRYPTSNSANEIKSPVNTSNMQVDDHLSPVSNLLQLAQVAADVLSGVVNMVEKDSVPGFDTSTAKHKQEPLGESLDTFQQLPGQQLPYSTQPVQNTVSSKQSEKQLLSDSTDSEADNRNKTPSKKKRVSKSPMKLSTRAELLTKIDF